VATALPDRLVVS
jgi:hypothetical protein